MRVGGPHRIKLYVSSSLEPCFEGSKSSTTKRDNASSLLVMCKDSSAADAVSLNSSGHDTESESEYSDTSGYSGKTSDSGKVSDSGCSEKTSASAFSGKLSEGSFRVNSSDAGSACSSSRSSRNVLNIECSGPTTDTSAILKDARKLTIRDNEETRSPTASPMRRCRQEYDLEQKIDVEIKMREGTTKLLAHCKHTHQSLEAAKSLLTSNERMSAYMLELQRRRKDGRSSENPGKARVSLSDLRMPLIWKEMDHFKNKGDYRRFAVFCLARIGTEIYDTSLLNPVDRTLTDLAFDDVIVFNNISHDFEFVLEVYSHVLHDDLSIASTSRKIKQTLHSSISRTVGKKLALSLKDELSQTNIGPKFDLVATARLSLKDVHNGIRTFDLSMERADNNSNQLPLFGHFGCRLAAQPDCMGMELSIGALQVARQDEPFMECWATIVGFILQWWQDKDSWMRRDANEMKTLSITKDCEITSMESYFVKLSWEEEAQQQKLLLKFSSTELQHQWYQRLLSLKNDHQRWQQASEEEMEIQTPVSHRQPLGYRTRSKLSSLYEETPLRDTPEAVRPSPPPVRVRSYSTTSGQTNWGSVRISSNC